MIKHMINIMKEICQKRGAEKTVEDNALTKIRRR